VGEPKIVITGTGRAGTTLLVRLLDELGLDTGLHEGKLTPYGANVRAGLESRVDDPDAPTVVKDLTLGFRLRPLLESGDVAIRHVLIPTRRIEVAAASRVRAAGYGRLPFGRGALIGTMRATEQRKVLETIRAEIPAILDEFGIPYTVIEFPRFATDAAYAHAQLRAVAPDASADDVAAALGRCVDPTMIHETPLSGREAWRTRFTTVWMITVRYPVGRVRRWIDPEGSQARLRASVAAAQRKAAEAEAEAPAGPDPRPPTS
jgi:hypothetical protein